MDFASNFPFVGEEIIDLRIFTPTLDKAKPKDGVIQGRFYIYKMADREEISDRSTVYQLHFISIEAIADINTKISKGFDGKISDIVTKFIKSEDGLQTSKNSVVEETGNKTKYISNFWSPVKNLNYLSTVAQNNDGSASYLFFENRSGFNFVSLDNLYKQNTFQKFIKDNYSRDLEGTTSIRNLNRDYQRILDFKVRVPFDALKFTNSGAYASRIYAYDLVKKKYFAKDYNALAEFDKTTHLNKKALYTDMKPVSPANIIFNEQSKQNIFQ